MVLDVGFSFSGIDRVIDGLTALDVVITGQLIPEDLEIIGERVLELAKTVVPVRTGALRDSLHMFIDDTNATVIIGTDIGYGKFVELGTSKMTAQPYLMPSLLTAINEFRQRFPAKISQIAIEKIKGV